MIASKFARFIGAGALNSLASFGLYLALAQFIHHTIAYTVAFIFGLGISYGLNTAFVFGVVPSVGTAVKFPAIYAVQYVCGVVLLYVLVDEFQFGPGIAAALVIAGTVPLTFLLSLLVFRRSAKAERAR